MAELGGTPVAWMHLTISESLESGASIAIAGLVVDRDHRGRGVGSLLMDRAEEWARAQGCAVVRLRSSAVRDKAHRSYVRRGYRHVKTQYSFVKSVDPTRPVDDRAFAPVVDTTDA